MAPHSPETTGSSTWRNRLALLIIVPSVLLGPTGQEPQAAGLEARPRGAVEQVLLAEELAAVEATRQTYAAAGLEFPDATIRFHGTSAQCLGHDGHYRLQHDGTATIDVCYPRGDADARHIQRTRTLWHEVAHAYIEPTVDETTKAAILDLLGLADWDNGSWDQLGKENAAEILVWGLTDGRYRARDVKESDCATKAAVFEMLAGLEGPSC